MSVAVGMAVTEAFPSSCPCLLPPACNQVASETGLLSFAAGGKGLAFP